MQRSLTLIEETAIEILPSYPGTHKGLDGKIPMTALRKKGEALGPSPGHFFHKYEY